MAEALELEQPIVVSVSDIEQHARDAGITVPVYRVVQELSQQGWLLVTGVRGVWEFAPASHAGALPHADPFVTFRAVCAAAAEPDGYAIALRSALWRRDLLDRVPERHDVVVPQMSALPPGIARALRGAYNLFAFQSRLPSDAVDGLPTHLPESVLLHLAERPGDVTHWPLFLDVLDALLAMCQPELVVAEATGRSKAALVRVAYLLGGRSPEIVEALSIRRGSVVWFGPRSKVLRSDSSWNVVDTILPRHPRDR